MASNSAFKDVPGIYKITYNNPNSEFDGFIYIGQSNSIYTRMLSYRFGFKYDTGHAAWWATMLKKHDKIDDFDKWFTVEILDTIELDKHDPKLKDILNKLEIQRIAEYDSTNRSHGFNVMRGGSGSLPKMKKNVYARKRTMGKNAHKYEPLFVYDTLTNSIDLYTSIVPVMAVTNMSNSEINYVKTSSTRLCKRYRIFSLDQRKRLEIVNRAINKAYKKIQKLQNSIAVGKSVGSSAANIRHVCDNIIETLIEYRYFESHVMRTYNFPISSSPSLSGCLSYIDKTIETFNKIRGEYSAEFNQRILKIPNMSELVIWDSVNNMSFIINDPFSACKALDIKPSDFELILNNGVSINGMYIYYANKELRDATMRNVRKRQKRYKNKQICINICADILQPIN